jgi:hypothetical protein
MKKIILGATAVVGLVLLVTACSSQPPPGRGGDRGPGDRQGGPPQGGPPGGGPPRFELGRVLPPPLIEELQLSPNQQAEIAKLEREVKQRLSKILTAEQKRKVEMFRPRGPGGPGGPGGQGGPPRGGPDQRPGGDGGRPARPDRPDRPDGAEAF